MEFVENFCKAVLFVFFLSAFFLSIVWIVCYTGAHAVSEGTHRPPLIVKITTPDGEEYKATVVFEGVPRTVKQVK